MRLAALVLATLTAVSCSGGAPALPTFELPTFDTDAIGQLVDDALAEVDRVAGSPIEVPPELAQVLDEHNIALPALPSNHREICDALGTPGVGSLAAAGMSTLIQELVIGGETGLVVGLLVVVTARTCPIWMPHLETALDEVL